MFAGTNHENTLDSLHKGRFKDSRGEKHPQVKLTESEVLEIRASHEGREALAKRFGMSKTMIGYIIRRQNWKHI